jgi:hypothetical protein
MGFYIRKSFKIGPLRLNLSKSGLGASVGTKGARLGLSSKGKLYTHLGRWGALPAAGSGFRQSAACHLFEANWLLDPDRPRHLFGLGIALPVVSAADRLDVFDQEGRRAGHSTTDQEAGRLDLFDRGSRRTGYGI